MTWKSVSAVLQPYCCRTRRTNRHKTDTTRTPERCGASATGPGCGAVRKTGIEGRHGRKTEVCPELEFKDGDR
jgi:hypothetical protein